MDWFVGLHHFREEGDVLAMTFVGDLSLQDAKQLLPAIDRLIERHGCYGTIIDMQRLSSVTPDARRFLGGWPGHRACYGNSCYGGNATARTLVILIMRAIQLFTRHAPPFAFFKVEQEARAWLAAQRERAGKP